MTIGERLLSLRKQHKMTLEDVAKYINVKRATVSRYETGSITNIPSDKIELLSKLFNVSPAYIMGWRDDPDETHESPTPIVVPDSESFIKIVRYMTTKDYETVMGIFEKTYKHMKEMGIEIK